MVNTFVIASVYLGSPFIHWHSLRGPTCFITKLILTLYGLVHHPITFRSAHLVLILQHIANAVPFCGNSVRSQMEANLASMISSHPDSIQHTQFPPLPASLTPVLKPACPACHRSSYRRVPPILSETSATPLQPPLSSALNSNHKRRCSSYFCPSWPRGLQTRHLDRRRFTQPIRERGNSSTEDVSVESRSSRP